MPCGPSADLEIRQGPSTLLSEWWVVFTAFPEMRRSRSTHVYGPAITAAGVQAVNETGAGLAYEDGFLERPDRTQGSVRKINRNQVHFHRRY